AGCQYFIILGPDLLTVGPGQERFAEGIRKEFNAWKGSELLALWDRVVASNDVDERVDAILFLAVSSPEIPDAEYASRIRSALVDEDKDVRNAAVVAAAYTDWRIFQSDIERVASSDSDPKARERAEWLLNAWDRQDQEPE